jgi:hypothetical protein
MYVKLFISISISLTLYSVIPIVLLLSATDHLIRAAVGSPVRRWSNSRYRPRQVSRLAESWGSQTSRQSAHVGVKVVSRKHRLPLHPRNISVAHLCWSVSRPQGHSAAGRIMSTKYSNDTIGNRTRNHPAGSAVPGSHGTQLKHAPRRPAFCKKYGCISPKMYSVRS